MRGEVGRVDRSGVSVVRVKLSLGDLLGGGYASHLRPVHPFRTTEVDEDTGTPGSHTPSIRSLFLFRSLLSSSSAFLFS